MLGRRLLGLLVVVAAVASVAACTSDNGSTAEQSPTASSSSTEGASPTSIKLMQFNIEYGGTVVDFHSVPKAIKSAGADVVALQEGYGNTCKVAKALDWPYCDPRTQTVSRYPLIQPADPTGAPETLVEVSPGSVFALINVHLPSTGYGPNKSAAGASPKELVAGERNRMKAIQPAIDAATRLEDAGTPVVIAGDFNSPSHRDWVEETVGLRDQVQVVDWPVSEAVEAAGLTDVYRSVHPDPVKDQGLTWPASRPKSGSYNPGPAGKPADRIDLMYASAGVDATDSQIVGESSSDMSDIPVDPWPSDHRAVVADLNINLDNSVTYVAAESRIIEQGHPITVHYNAPSGADSVSVQVNSANSNANDAQDLGGEVTGTVDLTTTTLPAGQGSLVLTTSDGQEVDGPPLWIAKPGATTTLSTGKNTYSVGEPIGVSWQLAPGNRWDWLGVYKRGADPNVAYYKLWGYTGATVDGQLQIDETANGSPWPLPPGKYDVILLKDDSYAEIARAPFTVQR